MNAIGMPVAPDSALFAATDARRSGEDFLTGALADALARVAAGSVVPTLDMGPFRQALEEFDFDAPRELADLLPWVIAQLEHGVVHLTHPRYFGLFNPQPSFPAECAERIVAAFNPQLATAKTSPVPVEIEAHVIRAVARRAGFRAEASGHFTTGGSEANFTALVCALTRAHCDFAAEGVRAFAGAPVMYVSEDAHHAWHKIAHQAGLGRASLRLIATDVTGRMDPVVLVAAVAADRAAGRVPVMVVATAGTTGAGMVDPIAACSDVARDVGAWFHVDAAWGGALIASDRLGGALAGIDVADSVTVDAHKWFATTMGCGMFITRDAAVLSDAFQASASYMPSNQRHLDPYVTTVQWSRRFLGLRLFLSLAAAGWRGYGAHVEHMLGLTDYLAAELVAQGWTMANDSPMGVLCLDPPVGFPDAATIAAAVVASGQAWVSSTLFRGRTVVRICVTNGQSSRQDVLALSRLLGSFGQAGGSPDSFNLSRRQMR